MAINDWWREHPEERYWMIAPSKGVVGDALSAPKTAVDRRFDRARYDAARAVDAFAARLRNQVDLDEVTAGLRDTVVATVAPTHVAVWLRVSSEAGGTSP